MTILTISFCSFHVKEAYGVEYEFESGFEEIDPFAEWTPDPVYGYGYEIQTSIVHAGVNACRSDDTSGGMLYELSSEYIKHYTLVYFYINGTVPDEFGGHIFIRIWDVEITVYIETNASRGAGKSPYIRFYDQMDDDFSVLDSQGLTLGAWHSVEIYTEGDSASANHKCWVDGRLIASEWDDTSGFNITGVDIYNVHWTGDYDGRVFIDDFASNDDVPMYYFNFNFKDLDSNDVQDHVNWALWNSTHDLDYSEGESTLYNGTYYLKTQMYGHLINTTTLDTLTYGNSTIDINLNMKRHQSCSDGYIVSNDTISSITIHTETPQLLNFTIEGNGPAFLSVGVPKNASYIEKYQESSGTFTSGGDFDDAYETGSGAFQEYGFEIQSWSVTDNTSATYRCGGSRCLEVQVEKGATIENAILRLYVHAGQYDDVDCHIYGETTTDPEDFHQNNNIINQEYRPRSTASIDWVGDGLVGWNNLDATSLVQELIDREGWASGKNISLLWIADVVPEGYKWCTIRGWKYSPYGTWSPRLMINSTWQGNVTSWSYVSGDSQYMHDTVSSFSRYTFHFNATSEPTVGPHGPSKHSVKIDVTLNGERVKGCNVSMEGNGFRWGLTNLFGRCTFKVKTGTYHIRARYNEYVQTRTVHIDRSITIPIELNVETEPTESEDFLRWIGLPEIDFTTYGFWVLVLPLILLVIYAVKRVLEGPKRKWKYSYLG